MLHPFSGFVPCFQVQFGPRQVRPSETAKVLRSLLQCRMVRHRSRVPHRYRWDCWASGPWLQLSHNWRYPASHGD